jgi:hypothetical protein
VILLFSSFFVAAMVLLLKTVKTNEGSIIKDLNGQMMRRPGYEPWSYMLDIDDSDRNWTFRLAFKKFSPAVRG